LQFEVSLELEGSSLELAIRNLSAVDEKNYNLLAVVGSDSQRVALYALFSAI
jgi:hypothetical protein